MSRARGFLRRNPLLPWLSLLLLQPQPAGAGGPLSGPPPRDALQVLDAIRRQQGRIYGTHRGVRSHRVTDTLERDPDTGARIELRHAEHDVVYDFYRVPSVTTLSCRRDGVASPPERCSERWLRLRPHVPIFDADGPRQYRLRLLGEATLHGRRCYVVAVEPRVPTMRHFEGTLHVARDTLALVQMEGTIARRPFPLRHLYMKLGFRDLGGGYVDVDSGYVDAWVRVPLLYKRRITTRFTASRHVPLPLRPARAAPERHP